MNNKTIFTTGAVDARFFSKILRHKKQYLQMDLRFRLENESDKLIEYTDYLLEHRDKTKKIIIKDCKGHFETFSNKNCNHIAAMVVINDENEIDHIKEEIINSMSPKTDVHFITIDKNLEKMLYSVVSEDDLDELDCIKASLESIKQPKKIILMLWVKKNIHIHKAGDRIKKLHHFMNIECEHIEQVKTDLHRFLYDE